MPIIVEPPTVWVVGDVMLDVTVSAPQFRRTPENAQVPVIPTVELDDAKTALGGAANLAANLAALGCRVVLFGRWGGNNEEGYVLGQLLAAHKIENRLLSSAATTTRTRYYESDRLLVRLDRDAVDAPLLPSRIALPEPAPHAIALTDYGRGVIDRASCCAWIALAHTRRIPVYVDPKIGRSDTWKGTDNIVLVANWAEAHDALYDEPLVAAQVAQRDENNTDNEAARLVQTLRRALSVSTVVVKRGIHGSSIAAGDGYTIHIPAVHPQRLFDVQGAGDSYLAGFIAADLRGVPGTSYHDVGLYASAAAGIAVGKPGTAVVTAAEVRKLMIEHAGTPRGVVAAASAYELAARLRVLDLTVGYASGCWDLRLHAGHRQLLAEAQLECDFLFVGVDSDRRVRQLKGPTRPVLPQDERAAHVAAVQGVGAAFVFDSTATYPNDVVAALQPHVLVLGGDYRGRPVPEADELAHWGGRLVLVDTVPDHSTTALIAALQRESAKPVQDDASEQDHRVRDG